MTLPPKTGRSLSQSRAELQALKELWYKKLKDEGFKDIETTKNDLKLCHSSYYPARFDPVYFWQKHDYYHATVQFLESHVFDSAIEKRIWQFHSEGFGSRVIAVTLNKKNVTAPRFNKDNVSAIIKRLREIMQQCVINGSNQGLERQHKASGDDEESTAFGCQLRLFDVA